MLLPLPTLPARAAAPAPSSTLGVSLATITPAVAVPKAAISIAGSVRNPGSVAITSPVVRALLSERPLTSRQAVADWGTSTAERSLTEVASISLGKTLAPRTVVRFVLTIPAKAVSHRESFAVLPLRVDAFGTLAGESRTLGLVDTFLPTLAAVKAYVPLSVALLVPLTLDPDPALQGMDSPARTAAWSKAIGPGSRLDRVIQGTQDAQVTWAIDPAILGPRRAPSAADALEAPGPTPIAPNPTTPGNTPPGNSPVPDPVTEATTALATRLRAAAPRHTLWSLPYADPDLAALLPLGSAGAQAAVVGHPSILDAAVGPARTDIAWPVEGTLTPQSQAQLSRAFAAPGLAAAVTSASTLANRDGSADDASRKSSTGLPMLAYDETLSRTVAQTSSRAGAAITIQRFLADSMALLGERPGTRDRSVLIAEPRTFAGDPTVLRSLFAAIATAPWLVMTTTDEVLAAAEKLDPDVLDDGATGPTGPTEPTGTATAPPPVEEEPTAPDPMSVGVSPLTTEILQDRTVRQSAVTGISSILQDGQLFRDRWTDAQDQLLSARWRGHPEGLTTLSAATASAVNRVSRSVNVAPSSVNFFADRGVLQVTVVNDLPVPIHDVHLMLTPAQPRLRIEQQPGQLRIGARSRANVPLQVTSIAAGLVPIEAVLSTRNGTPLGQNASVEVRVQPTGTWIYWVLGSLAGLVLVLGTYRSVRRGSTRASRPDARESPLHD